MTGVHRKKVATRLGLAGLSFLFFIFLLGAGSPQAETPTPAPASPVSEPIAPSNTSTYITQIALLLVSAGGVLAAVPPIVRSFRKSDEGISEEEQARIILAMARVLAEDKSKAVGDK